MTNQAVPLPPPTVLSSPQLSPVDSDHRLHTLDILRGLALFGMILVHFHQKMRIEVTGLEDLIGWCVWILVEQKAWGIFAFLFGVGFAVLLRRLEARNAPVVAIYLRRLAGLAVFGVIAQVGFGFSILLAYAAWGVVLLFIRRWSTPALLATAVVAAAARPVAAELTALYTWWTHGTIVSCALRSAPPGGRERGAECRLSHAVVGPLGALSGRASPRLARSPSRHQSGALLPGSPRRAPSHSR